MKNTKRILVSLVVLVIGLMAGSWAESYDTKAVCSQVHDGIATFTDCEGHYWDWEVEKGESFERNDVVMLTLHSLSTDMKIDDVILKIKPIK